MERKGTTIKDKGRREWQNDDHLSQVRHTNNDEKEGMRNLRRVNKGRRENGIGRREEWKYNGMDKKTLRRREKEGCNWQAYLVVQMPQTNLYSMLHDGIVCFSLIF